MKECPKCHAQYDDSLSFCREDGSRLIDVQSGQRTQHASSVPSSGDNPFAQELSFLANCFVGLNAVGGKLYIREEVAVFKAHQFNFGDMREKTIPIADISGYKKGMMTFLTIFLRNGEQTKFAVYDKDGIINALEVRRHALYQKIGQQPPALTSY